MKLLLSIGLVLALISCGGEQEQAIRHLVVAEIIQREHVTEDRIEVMSIQFTSPEDAQVAVKIGAAESRGGEGRIVNCTLKRESKHWTVQSITDQ